MGMRGVRREQRQRGVQALAVSIKGRMSARKSGEQQFGVRFRRFQAVVSTSVASMGGSAANWRRRT